MSATNPPDPNVNTFNNLYWISGETSLTQEVADKRYLRFPTAQGTENLAAINVGGLATFNNEIIQQGVSNNILQDQTTNSDPNILKATQIYGDLNLRKPTSTTGGAMRLWDVVAGINSSQIYTTGTQMALVNLNNGGSTTFTTTDGAGVQSQVLQLSSTGINATEKLTMTAALPEDRVINTAFLQFANENSLGTNAGIVYGSNNNIIYETYNSAGSHIFQTTDGITTSNTLTLSNTNLSIATTNPPTCNASSTIALNDDSNKIPSTAWVVDYVASVPAVIPSALTPNSVAINPSQTPNASGNAGITNPFNSSGFSSQFFSNVNYSFINIWVDFQGFNQGNCASYQDSLMVQVDIVWDGNNASPSASYGNCNFLCKLFPKRIFASPQWGTHYAGVSANTANSYTGLSAYNSTNGSYAPFGRQYWCYNIQGSQTCNVYGGASYCLFQFPNPMGAGNFYCASTSIRVLDSTIVQTNPISAANCGVKVYTNFQV